MTRLCVLRGRLLARHDPDGPYILVCARTGIRPAPVSRLRFGDRATADEAASIARRYRSTLRAYDPDLPAHDLVVREHPAQASSGTGGRASPNP